MHEGSFVFARLTSYLDRNKFNYLSRRESLRDLIVAVEAHSGKAKFLGFGDSVTRSNLAKANQNRDCRHVEVAAVVII